MEQGYVEAKSDNLPIIDPFMISVFFMDNMNYLSAEIKGEKNVRAARNSYGDQAIGYVQLKRENNVCIVKGRITPEHKIRGVAYHVTIIVDEGLSKIISSECHDCVASHGGCKHAIAFLYWLLRRTDEPSSTSVECYWKKPLLSKVGTSLKFLKASDLKPGGQAEDIPKVQGFLEKIITEAKGKNCEGNLVKYFTPETSVKKISMHYLSLNYLKKFTNPSSDNFLEYCESEMSAELCKETASLTTTQYKSSLWYELRYGRITASKIYEASMCSTLEGSLYEQILGAVTSFDSEAMKRGRELEDSVINIVAKQKNIKVKKTGLILNKNYPALGASPDALSDEFVIEVKCPSSEKTLRNYFHKNEINKKYLAQIQLQMLFCDKQKGLFCVAAPDFERTNDVNILEVDFNDNFIKTVIVNALKFWKNSIFSNLVR